MDSIHIFSNIFFSSKVLELEEKMNVGSQKKSFLDLKNYNKIINLVSHRVLKCFDRTEFSPFVLKIGILKFFLFLDYWGQPYKLFAPYDIATE
jgi:hypothetical protein